MNQPRSILVFLCCIGSTVAAAPPFLLFVTLLVASYLGSEMNAAEYLIQPGDSPQAVLENAASGDRIVFLPGLHQHRLGHHRSLLYVDKSLEIELQAGATLKLADRETILEAEAEITTDHGPPKKLDDLSVGGTYDLTLKDTVFTIVIDGEGKDGQPDTFAWGVGALFAKNVHIEGLTMTNTMRSVMLYGEHTGKFLAGGEVTPGDSFDAENINIQFTRTINPSGSGYLVVNSPGGWERPQPPVLRNNRNHLSDKHD